MKEQDQPSLPWWIVPAILILLMVFLRNIDLQVIFEFFFTPKAMLCIRGGQC